MSCKELMLIFLWTSCLSAAPDKYYSYDLAAKRGGNAFIIYYFIIFVSSAGFGTAEWIGELGLSKQDAAHRNV